MSSKNLIKLTNILKKSILSRLSILLFLKFIVTEKKTVTTFLSPMLYELERLQPFGFILNEKTAVYKGIVD